MGINKGTSSEAILTRKVERLEEALTNIREYVTMIPLHTQDTHALHFVRQIENWCDKGLPATGNEHGKQNE